jgi:Zn-dependent peptidase ImmA (M78 family)
MRLAFEKLKTLIPALNIRPLTEADFWFAAERYDIQVFEIPLKNNGYYVYEDERDYIFLKATLKGILWLETANHELMHALLHHPNEGIHDRQQAEADALALICMMPIGDLEDLSHSADSMDHDHYHLYQQRMVVYKKYGL